MLDCVRDGEKGEKIAEDADGSDDDRPRPGDRLEGGHVDGEAGVGWRRVVGASQPQDEHVGRAVAGQPGVIGCVWI